MIDFTPKQNNEWKEGEYELYCEQIRKLASNPNFHHRNWLEMVADGVGMSDHINQIDDDFCDRTQKSEENYKE